MCAPEEAPNLAAARENWRQPGPLGWKLRRLVANNFTKLMRRQHCCGRPGEPGC
jgi:hypothetical protein